MHKSATFNNQNFSISIIPSNHSFLLDFHLQDFEPIHIHSLLLAQFLLDESISLIQQGKHPAKVYFLIDEASIILDNIDPSLIP